jgi:multidrug efflux system membrane fusion protein
MTPSENQEKLHRHPRSLWAALVCLGMLASITAGCGGKGSAGTQKRGEGAMPVTVATVAQRDVPIDLEVIGNVEAYSTVTVKAQVGGELVKVYFNEGDYVRKGDQLFEIDRRPLEAALNQAQANQARDLALLGQAEANLARDIAQQEYVQAQAERYAELFKSGISSRDQTEQLRANANAISQAVKADRAAIESARAQIAAGQAAFENTRVQLSYTSIRSPIDGRTGNLIVKQGNIVVLNSMDLMTINQVQPTYVTFSIPEARLPEIKKYMAHGKVPVFAQLQEAQGAKETGVLTFVDNAVDLTTGTIKLKATFPNLERRLWPGQFVRVVVRLAIQQNGIVVPNQAVQTGQEGQFVYVVKADRTVELRPVLVGARVEQDLVIDRGLRPGETVVTEGQLRLAPGSRVQLREGRGGRPEGGRPGRGKPGS